MNPFTRRQRRITSRHILAIGMGAVTLTATAYAIFGAAKPSHDEAILHAPATSITVNVIAPTPTTFLRTIAATGTVNARDELVIGSDATGVRLTEVLVEVGSTVQRGQLLARGDDAQLRAQLAQQDAQIKQAQAELA